MLRESAGLTRSGWQRQASSTPKNFLLKCSWLCCACSVACCCACRLLNCCCMCCICGRAWESSFGTRGAERSCGCRSFEPDSGGALELRCHAHQHASNACAIMCQMLCHRSQDACGQACVRQHHGPSRGSSGRHQCGGRLATPAAGGLASPAIIGAKAKACSLNRPRHAAYGPRSHTRWRAFASEKDCNE